MANTLLNPTIITREALRVLHQSATFLRSISRQYDSRFANSGASPSGKIGPNLAIRMPNRFTVRSGNTINVQDIAEESQTLTVSTLRGVDFEFPSNDLSLSIDDFSGRYLRPAMSVLAANIENTILAAVYKDIYNIVDGDAAAFDFVHFSTAQEILNNELTPTSDRYALLKNAHINKFLVATKGLFNPQSQISGQFREGVLGNICDFDVMASSHLTNFTTGTAAKTTGYLANSATAQTGASIIVDTGTTTFLAGDIVTFAGVNRVHPETKVSSGSLQRFTITADSGASATSLAISPAIVATGAKQNVSNGVADNQAVVKVGAGANELLDQSIAYHRDAFTVVTADLVDMAPFGGWSSVQRMDNISMRIWRQGDITNNSVPTRIDVLFGYKTLRPELATRIHADG